MQESKKKAFTKHSKGKEAETAREASLERLRKEATVIRVLAHTQYEKLKNLPQKKDYIMEIQINGGSSTGAKVDFAKNLLEKQINVNSVFRCVTASLCARLLTMLQRQRDDRHHRHLTRSRMGGCDHPLAHEAPTPQDSQGCPCWVWPSRCSATFALAGSAQGCLRRPLAPVAHLLQVSFLLVGVRGRGLTHALRPAWRAPVRWASTTAPR